MPITYESKPDDPEWQDGHPLARRHGGAWIFDQAGGLARNLVAPAADGVLTGAGAVGVASPEGRAVGLDGSTGFVNCGTSLDVYGAARFSVWARFILRAAKAASTYSAIVAQWNDPGASNPNYQRFHLSQLNGFTRPANSFELSVFAGGTYWAATLQFQASDVGKVVTLVGTFDGVSRLYAVLPSGLVTAASANSSSTVGSGGAGTPTNTIWGRLDGFYLDCVLLAGGLLAERTLTLADGLELHADPYALFRPPPSAAYDAARAGLASPAVAPAALADYRRRRTG